MKIFVYAIRPLTFYMLKINEIELKTLVEEKRYLVSRFKKNISARIPIRNSLDIERNQKDSLEMNRNICYCLKNNVFTPTSISTELQTP